MSGTRFVVHRANSRLMHHRIVRRCISMGGACASVGMLISMVGASISQGGMMAWMLVMGVFGGLVSLIGARPRDVCVAAAIGAAGMALTTIGDSVSGADAVASGLLLGAVAGALFRPWCRWSLGSLTLLRRVLPGAPAGVESKRPAVTEARSIDADHREAA